VLKSDSQDSGLVRRGSTAKGIKVVSPRHGSESTPPTGWPTKRRKDVVPERKYSFEIAPDPILENDWYCHRYWHLVILVISWLLRVVPPGLFR
jgi:hypothetical protein